MFAECLAVCPNLRTLQIRIHCNSKMQDHNCGWRMMWAVIQRLQPTFATLREVRLLVYTPSTLLADVINPVTYDICREIAEKLASLPGPPMVSYATLQHDGTSWTGHHGDSDTETMQKLFSRLQTNNLFRRCRDDELDANELHYFEQE